MVFFIILGFIDLMVGVLMLATHYGFIHHWKFAIMGAVYLIGKGFLMRGSFLSVLDVIAGLYLIFIMFGLKTALVWFFAGLMVYKFAMSLIMRG